MLSRVGNGCKGMRRHLTSPKAGVLTGNRQEFARLNEEPGDTGQAEISEEIVMRGCWELRRQEFSLLL